MDLPHPSIDTGMGLERMAAILQGVESVFETDMFRQLIEATASALGHGPSQDNIASYRVIADHLRASSFLISDGVLPSNEGRGYVLRRIMRRAMRHAQLLGAKDPLMYRLVWALVREMGQAYPELVRAENLIEETLRLEETRFRKTLERGLSILDEKSSSLKKGDMFDGDTAFTLYDTYGFPLDLTQDALRNRAVSASTSLPSPTRWSVSAPKRVPHGREAAIPRPRTSGFRCVKSSAPPNSSATRPRPPKVRSQRSCRTARKSTSLKPGESGAVVLNQTPFYAESGGQVGDTGMMTGEGVRFRVTDTQKKAGDLFVHLGTVEQGTLKPDTALLLEVDHARRASIRAHHSATHLLHEALRQVLGDHIAQRGSLVAPDRLRFDFVHPKPITPGELARVEDIANSVVLENDEVTTRLMAVDDARDAGARALFGEKYGDEVRVVSMGKTAREHGANALGWSVELCGGTHVRRTGDIGLISVTGESAVASGVRRIEALTGNHARKHANDTMALARTAAGELRSTLDDMPARIAALMEERKKLERDLSDARKKLAMGGGASSGGAAASGVREVANIKLLARAVEGVETKDLKSLVDDGKKQIGSGVVAIVGITEDGKAGVVVGVTSDLTGKFNAVELVRMGSEALGGKGGGGRPDMAQAGGPDGAKADAALAAIEKASSGRVTFKSAGRGMDCACDPRFGSHLPTDKSDWPASGARNHFLRVFQTI